MSRTPTSKYDRWKLDHPDNYDNEDPGEEPLEDRVARARQSLEREARLKRKFPHLFKKKRRPFISGS